MQALEKQINASFLKKCNNIVDDLEKILNRSMLTKNQNKMAKILLLLKEIVEGLPYEQPDTTDYKF